MVTFICGSCGISFNIKLEQLSVLNRNVQRCPSCEEYISNNVYSAVQMLARANNSGESKAYISEEKKTKGTVIATLL